MQALLQKLCMGHAFSIFFIGYETLIRLTQCFHLPLELTFSWEEAAALLIFRLLQKPPAAKTAPRKWEHRRILSQHSLHCPSHPGSGSSGTRTPKSHFAIQSWQFWACSWDSKGRFGSAFAFLPC